MTIARRLVTHPKWKWLPGMLRKSYALRPWRQGDPLVRLGPKTLPDYGHTLVPISARVKGGTPAHGEPDLEDPATVGCLLALLREARKPRTLRLEIYEDATNESFIVNLFQAPNLGEAIGLALLDTWNTTESG